MVPVVMGVAADTIERPLRADARRNRERVLQAAEVLFAEGGLKVQIEQVAQRAGVGVGTVCRNFPTKQALVDAVLTGMCESLLADAQAALVEPDAGGSFRRFFAAMADFQARHLAFAEEMAADMDLPTSAVAVKASLRDAVDELVSRAQACGAIRPDIGPGDMAMLFSGIAHAASWAGECAPTLRQRYVAIVMDGLRPLNPTPLPGRPIAMAEVQQARRKKRA
ncbi:MAG: TetR/AcrR family transcriptional regulator [Actinomycetota bacterium]